jgi:hypothetical protein
VPVAVVGGGGLLEVGLGAGKGLVSTWSRLMPVHEGRIKEEEIGVALDVKLGVVVCKIVFESTVEVFLGTDVAKSVFILGAPRVGQVVD